MLDDLGNRVDHTDTRLRKVTRTLNDFIRKNEGECPCLALSVLALASQARFGWLAGWIGVLSPADGRYEELVVYWYTDCGVDHSFGAGDPHLMQPVYMRLIYYSLSYRTQCQVCSPHRNGTALSSAAAANLRHSQVVSISSLNIRISSTTPKQKTQGVTNRTSPPYSIYHPIIILIPAQYLPNILYPSSLYFFTHLSNSALSCSFTLAHSAPTRSPCHPH